MKCIFLNGERVDITDQSVRLGIQRNTSGMAGIEGQTTLGRKTAYSFMGAGFHGGNGLKATQNGLVWSMFVIPRLLYGLDVQLHKKKDIENLEKFQRQFLKQIQELPDNTSNSACLALLGIPPLETILHKNPLSMYVNMIRNGDYIEYEIAQRQLGMKEPHQKSLCNFSKDILELYELPSIFHLLNNPFLRRNGKVC